MSDLIQKLSDKKLLNIDESLVLAEGLDEAVIGITTIYPKRVVYDYWRCIDILLKDKDLKEQIGFDEALLFLEDYIEEIHTLSEFAPVFIKPIQ